MKTQIIRVIVAIALSGWFAATSQAVNVQLELSLLMDVSGSVSSGEYALQRDGYKAAFQDPTIQAAIVAAAANSGGGIAVNLIQWSGTSEQQQSIGWTQLQTAADANAFATAIGNMTRAFSGNTAPGSAINFAVPLFASNSFDAPVQIIDVSGDGAENEGATTSTARNNALAAGIDRINGLPILGQTGLLAWYQNNIQGGTNSFTLPASSFDDFENAMKNKVRFEITGGNPTPDTGSSLLLFFGVLATIIGLRRRFA